MNHSFAGKVALVTGAGSGIGLATAKAFGDAGASVVLADRREDAVRAAAEGLSASGGKALAVRCDVTDDTQVASMIDRTVSAFGRLDAAFNNAGVMQRRVDTAEISGEEWDRVMAINLRGVWSCMKYELPQMLRNGGGAIVNCSSIGGVIGVPGLAAYHAAKHGVIGLTKTAALEYATRKIRINAVCPGTINTPMAESLTGGDPKILAEFLKDEPIGRIAEPEEVAAGVLWLCSPGASYVVGHALFVDGGYTAH
ncbi:MAG: short chain dehydrogenase [Candidatus Rokuibacteriota bacterium]|nr:MAG: short chain dehydrogenase [Candidatus Rokubacteria bacterium]